MIKQRGRNKIAGVAAAALVALAGATVAMGAGSSTTAAKTTSTATAAAKTPETPLTGDVLAQVKAAAIAKVGGTVDSATAENDSSNPAAAYEAHVTEADGSRVTVILDSSFAVLSVETGGHGGHGHGGGNGEAALTGAVATQAGAAAIAKVGGTVERASSETDSSNAAAVYEVHVTKADGSHVSVILDKDYNVLSVETAGQH